MRDKESAEPTIKWADSEARKLLRKLIIEGKVPAAAKDEDGNSTMALQIVYEMEPALALYKRSMLLSNFGCPG